MIADVNDNSCGGTNVDKLFLGQVSILKIHNFLQRSLLLTLLLTGNKLHISPVFALGGNDHEYMTLNDSRCNLDKEMNKLFRLGGIKNEHE